MEARQYQAEAFDAAISAVRGGERPVISAATGAGKSIIICLLIEYAIRNDRRVLVLTHNQDLVKNNSDAWVEYNKTASGMTICCSGLGSRNAKGKHVVFASIETFKNRVNRAGEFNLVIIDECHRVNSDNGTYKDVLSAMMERFKYALVGLSATPFRTGKGRMWEHDEPIFTMECYSIGVKRLISDGFLTKVVSKGCRSEDDLSGSFVGGLVDDDETGLKITDHADSVCSDIVNSCRQHGRKSVIVFVPKIEYIDVFLGNFAVYEDVSAIGMTGAAASKEREECKRFLGGGGLFDAGAIRVVVNVGVLTTGVSINEVDTIVFARSMNSSGLMVQMAGRGMRLHDGKGYCLVLDYGKNLSRLGSIDSPVIRNGKSGGEPPMKVCDDCLEIVLNHVNTCPECGFLFGQSVIDGEEDDDDGGSKIHSLRASEVSAISDDITEDVGSYDFAVHKKDGRPDSVRMSFYSLDGAIIASNYICINHGGFAQQKAMEFISGICRKGEYFTELVDSGVINDADKLCHFLANNYEKYFWKISRLNLERNGKFMNILGYEID